MGFGYVFITFFTFSNNNFFKGGVVMYKSILSAVMALAAIICFGLGCAGSMPEPTPEYFKSMEKTAGEGESEIVFTRPSRRIGGTESVKIYIDDVERLRLGNGKTQTVVVPNGRHELRACATKASAECGKNRAIVVNAAGNRTVLKVSFAEEEKIRIDGLVSVVKDLNELRDSIENSEYFDDGKWLGALLNQYVEFPLGGSTVAQTKSSAEPRKATSGLDEAIKNAASKMINDLPDGSKIAVVEMATDDWELASTIIDEVEFNFVSSKRYTIVDRKTLDLIREEQILQTSGDVSDETIVKIGALSGANVVIAGSLTKSGGTNRLSLRALDVQTGQIITMARESY
jgi:hypothetical protein